MYFVCYGGVVPFVSMEYLLLKDYFNPQSSEPTKGSW